MISADKEIAGRLSHRYSAADCQAMMAVVMGTSCKPNQLAERVASAVNDPGSFLQTRVAKSIPVNFKVLLAKLRNEKPERLEVLLRRIHAACNIETSFLVDVNGVPSLHALRRVGLVAPAGPTAWGFAVVRTKGSGWTEWVLRNDPNSIPAVYQSVEELCREIVGMVRQIGGCNATAEELDDRIMHRLHAVMKLTGWCNFRVEEDTGGKANVVEIDTRILFDDICRRDIPELTIQGVNAPPFSP